jgi:hypothetical protein
MSEPYEGTGISWYERTLTVSCVTAETMKPDTQTILLQITMKIPVLHLEHFIPTINFSAFWVIQIHSLSLNIRKKVVYIMRGEMCVT